MSPRSIVPLVVLFAVLIASVAEAQRNSLCRDQRPSSASAAIAANDEPGERMTVSGRVISGPDQSPLGGVRLLAFQTDAEGYYSVGGMDERNARLCAVVSTDVQGRYEFSTIRPAHYATGGPPAHVHFELTAPGQPVRRFTLNFEGDPKLRGRTAQNSWTTVQPVETARDGTLLVKRDFWLQN